MKRISLGFIAAVVITPGVLAAVTVDGTIASAEYGANFQTATQTTQTGFGDNSDPSATNDNGGELDTLSVADDSNYLYVAIAGNCESSGNQIGIYLDLDNSVLTGANVIPAGGFNWHDGTTLPTGFGCDIFFTPNNSGGTAYMNSHLLSPDGLSIQSDFLGSTTSTGGTISGTVSGEAGSFPIAFNLSNIAGVDGGSGAAVAVSAEAVGTGLEVAIPRNILEFARGGTIDSDIKVFAAYGAGSGDFFSNQILPGLGTPAGNLGDAPNLSGESYVTYSPSAVPVELSVFTTE